jgi:enoyl-CoA hydratase/carnithine racemase
MRRKWHFSQWKAPVNQHVAHAQLIATYKRAQADAAHKQGLIKAVAAKGPKAIQAAVDTAAKAAKRRDGYAQKLAELGVVLPDRAGHGVTPATTATYPRISAPFSAR